MPTEQVTNLRVSMVTSGDPRFPAEHMLDGTTKSFWISTGLFPQEFIISLPGPHVIKKITLWSMKAAEWTISRSSSDKPFDFDEIYSEDIEDTPDQTLQITSFSVSYSDAHRAAAAKHLKFTLRRGYNDFVAVHRIVIMGEPDVIRDDEKERGDEEERVGRVVMVGGRD
ncbi:hypothetical protein BC830DRAFT_1151534 [Chytriomyces sp. MP71]|nr:hypothetical protein BC830DRAFT_1151534 [Chytriomyces sp. MP71]